jgi:hypothetical protein
MNKFLLLLICVLFLPIYAVTHQNYSFSDKFIKNLGRTTLGGAGLGVGVFLLKPSNLPLSSVLSLIVFGPLVASTIGTAIQCAKHNPNFMKHSFYAEQDRFELKQNSPFIEYD